MHSPFQGGDTVMGLIFVPQYHPDNLSLTYKEYSNRININVGGFLYVLKGVKNEKSLQTILFIGASNQMKSICLPS